MSERLGFTFYPENWWNSDTYMDELPEFRYIYLEVVFKLYTEDNSWKVTPRRLQILTSLAVSDSVFKHLESKFDIDSDGNWSSPAIEKRLRKTRANRENGKLGGRPKKEEKNPTKTQTKPKQNPPLEKEIEKEIEIRKEEFKKMVLSQPYPKSMLDDFFGYWTEHNTPVKKNTKMRFEMEKIFNLERRLVTWNKRSNNYGATNEQPRRILNKL
jgi:hypothetical protein